MELYNVGFMVVIVKSHGSASMKLSLASSLELEARETSASSIRCVDGASVRSMLALYGDLMRNKRSQAPRRLMDLVSSF